MIFNVESRPGKAVISCSYEQKVESLILFVVDVPFTVVVLNTDGTFHKSWHFKFGGVTIFDEFKLALTSRLLHKRIAIPFNFTHQPSLIYFSLSDGSLIKYFTFG